MNAEVATVKLKPNGHAIPFPDISSDDPNQTTEPSTEMAPTSRTPEDKAAIPNWLMQIVIGTFLALIGFVYSTIQKDFSHQQDQITDLKNNLSLEQVRQQNTREQLIAHGWTVDDQGNIHAPAKGK